MARRRLIATVLLIASLSSVPCRTIPAAAAAFQYKGFRHIHMEQWFRVNKLNSIPDSSSFDLTLNQYHSYTGADERDVRITYRHYPPSSNDDSSTTQRIVLFLNGLLSSMSGTKTRAVQKYANEHGAGFLCFDYQGHGGSTKDFVDCTMHDWMDDARHMLHHALSLAKVNHISSTECENHSKLPQFILVGSSMGAWIALHLTMEHPQLISGVIGIGSAIDITYYAYRKLSEDEQLYLTQTEEMENPSVDVSSPYLDETFPISRALYESGNDYLLCNVIPRTISSGYVTSNEMKLTCPVRFLHGSEDDVVHWSTVTQAVDVLQSKYHCSDVTVRLLDGGDHRLSRPEDVSILLHTLCKTLKV